MLTVFDIFFIITDIDPILYIQELITVLKIEN